ncbi:hypothetical protein ACOME3_008664 [Neoechinorhynchus agilis]
MAMLKEFFSKPRSDYAASPLFIPSNEDIVIDGRRVTYFDLSPQSPKPNLDRDLNGNERYRFYGFPYVMFSDLRFMIPGVLVFGLALRNKIKGIPRYRGHLPHVAGLLVGGFFIGGYIQAHYHRSRDQARLIVWDYVRKHSDDFPELFEKRKTYGEVLKSWKPCR